MEESQLLTRITVNPKIFGGKPIIRGRRLAVEHVLGISETRRTLIEMTPEKLDEYAGAYALGVVRVEREEDHLVITREPIPGSELMDEVAPPVRVGFYDTDRVTDPGELAGRDRGEFLRGSDGTIGFFRWGGRILPRYPADD